MRPFVSNPSLDCMMPRLEPLRVALRALPYSTLVALRHTATATCSLSPACRAWIKHVVDWELDRRAGSHYFMLFPEELVHPHDFARGAKHALADLAAALAKDGTPITNDLLEALKALVSRCEAYR